MKEASWMIPFFDLQIHGIKLSLQIIQDFNILAVIGQTFLEFPYGGGIRNDLGCVQKNPKEMRSANSRSSCSSDRLIDAEYTTT
jgi:hypothetical protein